MPSLDKHYQINDNITKQQIVSTIQNIIIYEPVSKEMQHIIIDVAATTNQLDDISLICESWDGIISQYQNDQQATIIRESIDLILSTCMKSGLLIRISPTPVPQQEAVLVEEQPYHEPILPQPQELNIDNDELLIVEEEVHSHSSVRSDLPNDLPKINDLADKTLSAILNDFLNHGLNGDGLISRLMLWSYQKRNIDLSGKLSNLRVANSKLEKQITKLSKDLNNNVSEINDLDDTIKI